MEIEVGEYVKFKDGNIDKIKDIMVTHGERKLIAFEKRNSYLSDLGLEKNIVKHSKNILDLIQVGDYVNGYKVTNVINGENALSGNCVDIDSAMDSSLCTFWEEDIKSIVTKESFASVEYEVEEK